MKKKSMPEVALQSITVDSDDPRPLSQPEATRRLIKYGRNVAIKQKHTTWPILLFHAILHPFNLILASLAVVSLLTLDYATAVVMTIMVLASTNIRFVQELKSEIAAESLTGQIHNDARVIRRNDSDEEAEVSIPIEDVVPGDIVKLSAGDMIPGDIRLLSSNELFISQAALTGESLPVLKSAHRANAVIMRRTLGHSRPSLVAGNAHGDSMPPNTTVITGNSGNLEEVNLCFMGTCVVSGSATAVVNRTGKNTLYAAISSTLQARRSRTAFQAGLLRVSYMFIAIMLITLPLVFMLIGFTKNDWMMALTFSIAIAVGLTPEILPAVVNANLSRGALELSKHNTIVKRMDSIMNFGGMNVLCTDKTGTLTADRVSLVKALDADSNETELLPKMAFLNSKLQHGLRNLLDLAIQKFYVEITDDPDNAEMTKPDDLLAQYSFLEEIPYDFQRRRVSVLMKENATDKQILCTKGAVEEVLAACESYRRTTPTGDTQVELTDIKRAEIITMSNNLNNDGLRVLAVAIKTVSIDVETTEIDETMESQLEFIGFVAFLDPPKESAAQAIRDLNKNGVEIKVLTGDSPLVCAKVCREIGIIPRSIVTGADVEALNDKELRKVVKDANIFAKLSPMQKARIIKALKRNGDVVGFMGDGINDAPALRESDVGISVDTGTAIAKETADIILLEKDLNVLVHGVIQGRITYGNTMKYLKISVSNNFGSIFSVIIGSLWLPFLPMLPQHIVLQNLLFGAAQIAIPWDNVDEEVLLKPRRWSATSIFEFMLFLGPVAAVFDILTFAFLLNVTGWNTPEHEAMFHAGWFLTGIFTQQVVFHVMRTERVPFYKSKASRPIFIASTIVTFIALMFALTPLAPLLKMEAPEPLFWAFLPCAVIFFSACSEVTKIVYKKLFNRWI